MIMTELRLLIFVLIIFLLTTSIIIVDSGASRCYLCSQNTLAECAGSTQPDSALFTAVLRYYTEPCNGQCILFRNEKNLTIRGCSWTYGHMTPKSIGWHELSPGILAYFCDSYLCNNGTVEQPDKPMIRAGTINDDFILSPQQTLTPQELFIIAGNTPAEMHTDQHLPSINNAPRLLLRQCYSCTARLAGCDEFVDPRYVSKYIRPCRSSCIIFRNPTDHNLITRDCSASWPQVHVKSGLHKLLGSDAFFCQESLCNGINFDFLMGIFHNQLPAVITFPPSYPVEDTLTTTITTTTTTTTTAIDPISPSINIDDNNVVWEDPDLDFVIVEPTMSIPTASTSFPFPTEFPDDADADVIDESTTIPVETIEHFDLIEAIPASSTIAGGIAVAEQDSQLNWWDLNEVSFPSIIETNNSPLTSTIATSTVTLIPSTTVTLTSIEEDEWAIFNTSSTSPPITHFEHLSDPEIDFDMNEFFLFPTLLSTTPVIDLIKNNTPPFVPFYFTDYNSNEQLIDFEKPAPTLAMPPFSWMLSLANQNKSEPKIQQNIITTSSTIPAQQSNKKKRLDLKKTLNINLDPFYEYCNKKQCQNGGRLSSDCLCICLPAFSGNNCEIVHCNQQPAHICNFVLEHECKSDYVRYLCPRFCQMSICSSNKSS